MNKSSPQIKIQVDPTNPGQFFACCGLLELADRLTGKAEGWFENDKGEFVINAETDLETLAQKIVHAQMKFLDKDDEADNTKKIQIQKDSAVLIGEPFMIRIDWWKKPSKDGEKFKNWAGRQKIHNILNCLCDSLKEIVKKSGVGCNLLSQGNHCKSRPLYFSSDSDFGSYSSSIDLGFSLNALQGTPRTRMKTLIMPATEFFAFIGLQRFRPLRLHNRDEFIYQTWDIPLSPKIASICAHERIFSRKFPKYRFKLMYRTEYLKAFLTATLQPV